MIFPEVTVTDASDFETELEVISGGRVGYRVLHVRSSVMSNSQDLLVDVIVWSPSFRMEGWAGENEENPGRIMTQGQRGEFRGLLGFSLRSMTKGVQ